jgi:23S rRNA (adenine-N6)-dimethyltransferase
VPGGQPRRWGFHRLTDAWARRLVADARLRSDDLVLDIGAGTGALTAPLAATGARVVAIELDLARRRVLQQRFPAAERRTDGAGVRVVAGDAADLRLPRQPFRVVANPPFAASTALLKRLLAPGSRLVAADLVLPVPVAVRWASGRAPGAGRWLRDFDLSVGRRLPATAFRPEAPATCAVLRIRRRR